MAPCAWLLLLDKAWCPWVTLLCTLGRSWTAALWEAAGAVGWPQHAPGSSPTWLGVAMRMGKTCL